MKLFKDVIVKPIESYGKNPSTAQMIANEMCTLKKNIFNQFEYRNKYLDYEFRDSIVYLLRIIETNNHLKLNYDYQYASRGSFI